MIISIISYLYLGITGLTTLAFLIGCIIRNIKEKKSTCNNIIQWPIVYTYVGVAVLLVNTVLNVFLMLDDISNEEKLGNMLSFSFIFIIGLIICAASLNWKIVLEEESFTYTNYFGLKRRFNYADLKVQIHRPISYRYLLTGDKKTKIIISTMCNNASGIEQKIYDK